MEKITKILNNYNYGDIIPYNYLEQLLECKREDKAFIYKIYELKNTLVEYSYILVAENNVGYRVLFPNEITEYAVGTAVIHNLGKLAKAHRMLYYADKTNLTKNELAHLEEGQALLSYMHNDYKEKTIKSGFLLNTQAVKEIGGRI